MYDQFLPSRMKVALPELRAGYDSRRALPQEKRHD